MRVVWRLYECYMVFVWYLYECYMDYMVCYYFILLHVFIVIVKNTYFEGFLMNKSIRIREKIELTPLSKNHVINTWTVWET